MALLDFIKEIQFYANQGTPVGEVLAKERLMEKDSGIRTQEQQRLAQQQAMQMQQRGQALASALPEQLRGFEGLVQATGEVDPALDLFKAQQEAQMLQQQIAARREAAAQAASAPTALQKDYQFLLQQGYDQKTAIDMLRKGVNVNVGAGENEFQKTTGKAAGDFVNEVFASAPDIQKTMFATDTILNNLEKGAYVGPGADAVQIYKSLLGSIGKDPELLKEATDIEEIDRLLKGEVLSSAGGSLGAGFSNADRAFVEAKTGKLGGGAEDIRRAAVALKASAKAKSDVLQITSEAVNSGNGMMARDLINQYYSSNPLQKYYKMYDEQTKGVLDKALGENTMPKASGEQAPVRKRFNPATGMVE